MVLILLTSSWCLTLYIYLTYKIYTITCITFITYSFVHSTWNFICPLSSWMLLFGVLCSKSEFQIGLLQASPICWPIEFRCFWSHGDSRRQSSDTVTHNNASCNPNEQIHLCRSASARLAEFWNLMQYRTTTLPSPIYRHNCYNYLLFSYCRLTEHSAGMSGPCDG